MRSNLLAIIDSTQLYNCTAVADLSSKECSLARHWVVALHFAPPKFDLHLVDRLSEFKLNLAVSDGRDTPLAPCQQPHVLTRTGARVYPPRSWTMPRARSTARVICWARWVTPQWLFPKPAYRS